MSAPVATRLVFVSVLWCIYSKPLTITKVVLKYVKPITITKLCVNDWQMKEVYNECVVPFVHKYSVYSCNKRDTTIISMAVMTLPCQLYLWLREQISDTARGCNVEDKHRLVLANIVLSYFVNWIHILEVKLWCKWILHATFQIGLRNRARRATSSQTGS